MSRLVISSVSPKGTGRSASADPPTSVSNLSVGLTTQPALTLCVTLGVLLLLANGVVGDPISQSYLFHHDNRLTLCEQNSSVNSELSNMCGGYDKVIIMPYGIMMLGGYTFTGTTTYHSEPKLVQWGEYSKSSVFYYVFLTIIFYFAYHNVSELYTNKPKCVPSLRKSRYRSSPDKMYGRVNVLNGTIEHIRVKAKPRQPSFGLSASLCLSVLLCMSIAGYMSPDLIQDLASYSAMKKVYQMIDTNYGCVIGLANFFIQSARWTLSSVNKSMAWVSLGLYLGITVLRLAKDAHSFVHTRFCGVFTTLHDVLAVMICITNCNIQMRYGALAWFSVTVVGRILWLGRWKLFPAVDAFVNPYEQVFSPASIQDFQQALIGIAITIAEKSSDKEHFLNCLKSLQENTHDCDFLKDVPLSYLWFGYQDAVVRGDVSENIEMFTLLFLVLRDHLGIDAMEQRLTRLMSIKDGDGVDQFMQHVRRFNEVTPNIKVYPEKLEGDTIVIRLCFSAQAKNTVYPANMATYMSSIANLAARGMEFKWDKKSKRWICTYNVQVKGFLNGYERELVKYFPSLITNFYSGKSIVEIFDFISKRYNIKYPIMEKVDGVHFVFSIVGEEPKISTHRTSVLDIAEVKDLPFGRSLIAWLIATFGEDYESGVLIMMRTLGLETLELEHFCWGLSPGSSYARVPFSGMVALGGSYQANDGQYYRVSGEEIQKRLGRENLITIKSAERYGDLTKYLTENHQDDTYGVVPNFLELSTYSHYDIDDLIKAIVIANDINKELETKEEYNPMCVFDWHTKELSEEMVTLVGHFVQQGINLEGFFIEGGVKVKPSSDDRTSNKVGRAEDLFLQAVYNYSNGIPTGFETPTWIRFMAKMFVDRLKELHHNYQQTKVKPSLAKFDKHLELINQIIIKGLGPDTLTDMKNGKNGKSNVLTSLARILWANDDETPFTGSPLDLDNLRKEVIEILLKSSKCSPKPNYERLYSGKTFVIPDHCVSEKTRSYLQEIVEMTGFGHINTWDFDNTLVSQPPGIFGGMASLTWLVKYLTFFPAMTTYVVQCVMNDQPFVIITARPYSDKLYRVIYEKVNTEIKRVCNIFGLEPPKLFLIMKECDMPTPRWKEYMVGKLAGMKLDCKMASDAEAREQNKFVKPGGTHMVTHYDDDSRIQGDDIPNAMVRKIVDGNPNFSNAGRRILVTIPGPSGMGKTSLIYQLIKVLTKLGIKAAHCRTDEIAHQIAASQGRVFSNIREPNDAIRAIAFNIAMENALQSDAQVIFLDHMAAKPGDIMKMLRTRFSAYSHMVIIPDAASMAKLFADLGDGVYDLKTILKRQSDRGFVLANQGSTMLPLLNLLNEWAIEGIPDDTPLTSAHLDYEPGNGDDYKGSEYFKLDNYPVEHKEDVQIVFRLIKKVYLGWKSTEWKDKNGRNKFITGIIENYATACAKNNFECFKTSAFSLDKGSLDYHAELNRIAEQLKELISGSAMKPIATSIRPTSKALQVNTLPGKYHGNHVTVNFVDGNQEITEIGLTLYSLILSKMITVVVGGKLTGTMKVVTKKKTIDGSVSMYIVNDIHVGNVSIYAPVKEHYGKLIPDNESNRIFFEDVKEVSLASLVNFRAKDSLHMTIKTDGAAKPVDAGLFLQALRGIGEPVDGKEFDIANAEEVVFEEPDCVYGILHL